MINELQKSLDSALSKLYEALGTDSALLNEAVAIVFSSLFRKYHIECIIVGGQSAAYWMRVPGSTDVDIVSRDSSEIAETLEACGFVKNDKFGSRFKHSGTDVLIEIVGEQIQISGVQYTKTVEIESEEIENDIVRMLMQGSAEALEPTRVFLNYLEASSDESIWFDYEVRVP